MTLPLYNGPNCCLFNTAVLTVSEIKKKKSCQPMCQTALPFHYSFLLPAVLFICLDQGNVLLLHCLTLLQHFFFQGFKRQAGQPGMLRQLAGPLRQIKKKKKVSCSHSCFMHKPNPRCHTHTYTHSPSAQMIELFVCGPPASCVLFSLASFQPGELESLPTCHPKLLFPIIN